MSKKIVLVLFILLVGCENKSRNIACILFGKDSEIYINIHAKYDDIESVEVKECFDIPSVVMADEKKFAFLNSQLDNTYHFEGNKLIKDYCIALDDTYSLEKTIEGLRTRRFYCE